MDTNGGEVPLGTDLKRWSWSRTHDSNATEIRYEVEDGLQTRVRFDDRGEQEAPLTEQSKLTRTWWGLHMPQTSGALVESSPFYARSVGPGLICESADLQRFRSPFIRWMADWRTRYEAERV
jgi:carotenoid 1,2-hydratase